MTLIAAAHLRPGDQIFGLGRAQDVDRRASYVATHTWVYVVPESIEDDQTRERVRRMLRSIDSDTRDADPGSDTYSLAFPNDYLVEVTNR